MSYVIVRNLEFDAGHRVPLHGGKCATPHGHRYRVEVADAIGFLAFAVILSGLFTFCGAVTAAAHPPEECPVPECDAYQCESICWSLIDPMEYCPDPYIMDYTPPAHVVLDDQVWVPCSDEPVVKRVGGVPMLTTKNGGLSLLTEKQAEEFAEQHAQKCVKGEE